MRELKDSGIEWIGEIPEDWETRRLKNVLKERKENNEPIKTDNILSLTNDRGVILYSEKGNIGNKAKEDLRGYKIAYKDDIVMNSMNVVIGSVGLSPYYGCVSPVYYMLYTNIFDIKYYNYIFQSKVFQNELKGLGNGILEIRMRIPMEKLNDVILPIPPIPEQQKIAQFLDNKVATIDNIIDKTKETIEDYKKYKQSLITEVVTKGLDKNAEMKDSGVEWIGKIPKSWGVIRGKYCLQYLQKPINENDGVITCFRDGEVTLRSKRREEGFTISDKEIGYQGIDIGDLVVHSMDGFAGAIGISDSRGKASPVLNVLNTKQNKRYIMYYLRSMAYSDVFIALATGIRIRSCDLRWNKLSELFYIVPPKNEQDMIATYIDNKLKAINNVIIKQQQQLKILEQYKKSIIYEYVTGKKEVK